jgi:hypothetical protein
MQRDINQARFSLPIVLLRDRDLPEATRANLAQERDRLLSEEADLEVQISRLTAELNAEYEQFRAKTDVRMRKLADFFSKYATEFLGHPCTLTEISQPGHSRVSIFVPEFNGVVRESPDTCSEAQRFFLDIALRMALIDLASSEYGERACFICETPETALDVSYVNNVVRMMSRFCEKGHTLLLTANIQENGVAEKLLHTLPKKGRPAHAVNLLELGKLSQVHIDALGILKACVTKALTG